MDLNKIHLHYSYNIFHYSIICNDFYKYILCGTRENELPLIL